MNREQTVTALEQEWAENPRWQGVRRGYRTDQNLLFEICAAHHY